MDSDTYLLACVRYIELNPMRARMVAEPEAYPWSSCRYPLGHPGSPMPDEDPSYRALGATSAERRVRYRRFLHDAIPDGA